jgi:hypothetical protein
MTPTKDLFKLPDARHSDAWENPLTDGQGNFLHSILTDTMVILACKELGTPLALSLVRKHRLYGWTPAQRYQAHRLACDQDKQGTAPPTHLLATASNSNSNYTLKAGLLLGTPVQSAPLAGYCTVTFQAQQTGHPAHNILALIKQAQGSGLKWPKIHLQDQAGFPVIFSVYGPKSKYCGQIRVTEGQGYGDQWFGRIDEQGVFHPASGCPATVLNLMKQFNEAPAAFVAAYGKKTGNCSFCKKALTDAVSVHVGYGPTCAEKYGLPHSKECLK